MLCNLGPCPRPVRGGVGVVWAVRVWARWYIYDICMFPYFELRGAALFPIWITAPVLGPGNHNKADQKDADSGGPPCLHSMVQNSKLSYFAKANSFSGETAKCKIFVLSTFGRHDGRLCCCVTMLILLMLCGHWTAAASSLINI